MPPLPVRAHWQGCISFPRELAAPGIASHFLKAPSGVLTMLTTLIQHLPDFTLPHPLIDLNLDLELHIRLQR